MRNLTDARIRELWAEHYARRLNHAKSMSLCVTLSSIAEQRARKIVIYKDWWDKLEHALAVLGIPRIEYNQVKSDQDKRGGGHNLWPPTTTKQI